VTGEVAASGVVPDISGWKAAHMIGIGGAGMSGIARLLLARGCAVTGTDLKQSRNVEALRDAGATIFIGHRAERIGTPDGVVVSTAIPATNVEWVAARHAGIPVFTRAQVLAALMKGLRSVAVAGTHGKTTTTSMIFVMLSRAGRSPTFVIGGDLNESGSGAGHGTGEVFVAEADESDGSFLLLAPEIAVITNVEEDHLDFYAGKEEIEAAFGMFADSAGSVVACWDDPGVRRALARCARPTVRYGEGPGLDVTLRDVEVHDRTGRATVSIGGRAAPVTLSVPGRHNLVNAAAALAVAGLLGIPPEEAARALRTFTGVRRRFEPRGEAGGAVFVDDYAHHPTEIAATLQAARAGSARRVVAVFQPHRYTRTEAMWRALGESLGQADLVVLTEVYPAGEPPIPGVSGKLLAEALAEAAPGKRIVYLPRRSEVAPFLAREVREGDLVLTMGAGDITTMGDEVIERILGRTS
jgi:UDP-N-acetylmuramate--alanine ligase